MAGISTYAARPVVGLYAGCIMPAVMDRMSVYIGRPFFSLCILHNIFDGSLERAPQVCTKAYFSEYLWLFC